eukprot:jgi/Ulvmu1/5904/UM026_0025.1
MSSPSRNKRREMDVMKLLMSDWKVELINDSTKELEVDFTGPAGSPYEGGLWKVRVEIPDSYPYKSPSIGFKNRIYHPNVDEAAGSVCLDVINQTWSPLFELVNVFEVFLPQLLLYPNPTDPLNGDAAALLIREPESFDRKVRDYVTRYASDPARTAQRQREMPAPADTATGERGPDASDDPRNESLASPCDHHGALQDSSSLDDNMAGMLTDSDDGD